MSCKKLKNELQTRKDIPGLSIKDFVTMSECAANMPKCTPVSRAFQREREFGVESNTMGDTATSMKLQANLRGRNFCLKTQRPTVCFQH